MANTGVSMVIVLLLTAHLPSMDFILNYVNQHESVLGMIFIIPFTPLFNFYLTLIIRSTNSKYVGATKNGAFKLIDDGKDTATQWEY